MRLISFTPEESDLFATIYLAFLTSRKAPENMTELSTATGVLTKLKSISQEPPDATANTVGRVLLSEGGEMKLEEVEHDYLTKSIFPPNARWTHQGIETLAQIQEKFESSEKE